MIIHVKYRKYLNIYLFETGYESVIVGGVSYFLLYTEIPRYERQATVHRMTLGISCVIIYVALICAYCHNRCICAVV